MKKIIIITFFLIVSNVYADEVRMATSEDIDLFDQAVEASTKIEKSNFKSNLVRAKRDKLKLKDQAGKGKGPKPKSEDSVNRGGAPPENRSSLDNRADHREERSGNKRRNKKRKKHQ